MPTPVTVGDRVLVIGVDGPNPHVLKFDKAEVGDKVIGYPLGKERDTKIFVPKLSFNIGDKVWATPAFPMAGFNWALDFKFDLIPIGLFGGIWVGKITDSYTISGALWGFDSVSPVRVNSVLTGYRLYILSGTYTGKIFEILDNTTTGYKLSNEIQEVVVGSLTGDISYIPTQPPWLSGSMVGSITITETDLVNNQISLYYLITSTGGAELYAMLYGNGSAIQWMKVADPLPTIPYSLPPGQTYRLDFWIATYSGPATDIHYEVDNVLVVSKTTSSPLETGSYYAVYDPATSTFANPCLII